MPLDRPDAGSFGARLLGGLLNTMTQNLQQRRTAQMEQEKWGERQATIEEQRQNELVARQEYERGQGLAAEERGKEEYEYRRGAGLEDYAEKAKIDAQYAIEKLIASAALGGRKAAGAAKPTKPLTPSQLLLLIERIPDLEGAFTPGDKWDMAEFLSANLPPDQPPSIEDLQTAKKYVVGENLAVTASDPRLGIGAKLGEVYRIAPEKAVKKAVFSPEDVSAVLMSHGLLSGPIPVGRNYSAEDVARVVAHNADDPLIFQRPDPNAVSGGSPADRLRAALWDLTMDLYNTENPPEPKAEGLKAWSPIAADVYESIKKAFASEPDSTTGRTNLGKILGKDIDKFFWKNLETEKKLQQERARRKAQQRNE